MGPNFFGGIKQAAKLYGKLGISLEKSCIFLWLGIINNFL